eukprot:GHUV01046596.1.p1 GENE.GHUV01046596.1~~GHUV01046596.1.p1  ORF type:complete len:146 (-),score=4.79 GHUV01046596.1:35-472(-)
MCQGCYSKQKLLWRHRLMLTPMCLYGAEWSSEEGVVIVTSCNPQSKHNRLAHVYGTLVTRVILWRISPVCTQVLAVYPTTIRRKILRQLYSIPMHECYLFDKCGVKFLDALMLGARVELFLPKVRLNCGVVICSIPVPQAVGSVR